MAFEVRDAIVTHKKHIILAVCLIFILVFGFKYIRSRQTKPTVQGVTITQKSEDLNKEFTFPVSDTIKLKFSLQKAELSNQIVVQGQNATAVPGRTFLIVTIKIVNDSNQTIKMNTRDYVRLSVNGDEGTWLAPDIHNDPVEVQAISTKYTRVGFPVNTSDKNFKLQIGEIKGDKEKIDLNL